MDDLLILFCVAGGLAAVLANIGLWSAHRLRVKLGALLAAALFLPTAYMSLVSLLSRPKPIALEWTQPAQDETTLLASQMEEDVAIYLWVDRHGIEEPRAYVLPWDEQLARELHEAQRAAESEGGRVQVRMSRRHKNQERVERMFYAAPPPAPPPKTVGSAAENRSRRLADNTLQ